MRFPKFFIALSLIIGFQLPSAPTFAVIASPTASCVGANCTVSFTTTNDYYDWVVPTGISSISVDLRGAKGGNATYGGFTGIGGSGGRVTATLTVTPGATLRIYVGGQGGNNTVGGYNGGGTANGVTYGGSGGGASDIRVSPYALADRVLVAGGGGGSSGGSYTSYGGGAGGGLIGQSMGNCSGSYYGGGGGTQSAGGAKGYGYNATSDGTFGVGGGIAGSTHTTGGGGGWYGGGGGSVCGGGGGSSYSHPTLASGVTHYQGVNAGTGSVSITYSNVPFPTAFQTLEPANSNTTSNVSYAITFSQNVNSVASGDFSNAGTATGCVFSIDASSGTNFVLTVSSCSEGTLIPQVIANSVYGTATSTNGPAANTLTTTPIVIDRTLPTIASVTAPANGTYKPSDTPTFSVQFSESVTVSGTPRLVLTVGSQTRYANYVSKSDSRTALFRYTVGISTSEVDADGISLATDLDLNSGSVVDSAGNALVVVGLTPPTLTSVLVAQPPAAPTIDSIAATSTQLSVYFRPGATYGSSITNYEYSTNNGSSWTIRSPVSTVSPLVITGLTDNTSYQVRIRAVSGAGTSDSSTALTGTPTAIVVSGNSSLTTTFGTSANTGTYTASGGTGPYTFSLSNTANSISISGGVVTVASTTPAGTYTRDVIATDSQSKTGLKQLIITVSKASSTISLALQGGGTSTPAGQAPVLNITTSIAGSVDFFVGGGGLPSCTAIAIASTTGTCTLPTPPSTGSVTVTAIFTPTSGNYETSTASITLTIVDGVSTITISLAGGVTQVPKNQAIVITAAIDKAGKVSFYADGKRIPGCFNLSATVGNKTCSWKPSVQKQVNLTATLNPTSSVYKSSSVSMNVAVIRRTGTR